MSSELIFSGSDWNFDTLRRCYDAIEEIAERELHLEIFPNRIEVITAEQMLDIYTAHGMPLTYHHWSYGKHFIQHEANYRGGFTNLAYEVVINSSPCISYLMEGNSATMQALVIAHAAFGHNHFFRNNHLFRQWTEPSAILKLSRICSILYRTLRGQVRSSGSRAYFGCGTRIVSAWRSPPRR